jgi:TRAP-type C4-dicarboxylate transport system substrate-binding protein
MESMIFTTALGAKPIVMDFGEVPTALQTGLIDGADYSSLATNYAGGHYEQNTDMLHILVSTLCQLTT